MEWLGKYENFIEKLVRFSNVTAQITDKQIYLGGKVKFTPVQIQILEYLLSHKDEHQKMSDVAAALGISASSFSKNTAKMRAQGILKQYHRSNNRKDIILCPTKEGEEAYQEYVEDILQFEFRQVFQMLDEIPADSIEKLGETLEYMTARHLERIACFSQKTAPEPTLIPIE